MRIIKEVKLEVLSLNLLKYRYPMIVEFIKFRPVFKEYLEALRHRSLFSVMPAVQQVSKIPIIIARPTQMWHVSCDGHATSKASRLHFSYLNGAVSVQRTLLHVTSEKRWPSYDSRCTLSESRSWQLCAEE